MSEASSSTLHDEKQKFYADGLKQLNEVFTSASRNEGMDDSNTLKSVEATLPSLWHEWTDHRSFRAFLPIFSRLSSCHHCTANQACMSAWNPQDWINRIIADQMTCNSCGILLSGYDTSKLPHEQNLSTFTFIWKDIHTCKVPSNIDQMVCSACLHIWELCGRNMDFFNKTRLEFIRPPVNGSCFVRSTSDRLIYEAEVDTIKYTPSVARHPTLKNNHTLKSTWFHQRGLVIYPRPGAWHEDAGWAQSLDQATKARLVKLENLKKSREAERKQKRSQATSAVLSPSGPRKKARTNNTQMGDLSSSNQTPPPSFSEQQYICFWVPLNPDTSSTTFWSACPTPRNRAMPLSSDNYVLTTHLFKELERRFSYADVLIWLMNVTYWNMNQDSIQALFRVFKLSRFKPLESLRNQTVHQRWAAFHPYSFQADWIRSASNVSNVSSAPNASMKDHKRATTNRFVIPHLNYQEAQSTEEMTQRLSYLDREIRKLHITEHPHEQLLNAAKFILHYLCLKEELWSMKQRLIEFYNQHVYPLESQLNTLKQNKFRQDSIIQPVFSRLQQHRLDQILLQQVGLEADRSVSIQQISNFSQLKPSECMEMLRQAFPTYESNLLKQVADTIRTSKGLVHVLQPSKAFEERLRITNCVFTKQIAQGCKKMRASTSRKACGTNISTAAQDTEMKKDGEVNAARNRRTLLSHLPSTWLSSLSS